MSYVGDPGKYAAAATLSDSVFEPNPFRALWIGTSGDVNVHQYNGQNVTYRNVPVGILPVHGLRVNVTGTSASQIICMW